MFRAKPNGSYQEIDSNAIALKKLNRLRLGTSADLVNSRSRIVEAHDLFTGNQLLVDGTPANIFQFAVQTAEAEIKLGRETEAGQLFTTIKESAAKLRNHEFGNAILTGAVKACHRNGKFELARELTEGLTEPALRVKTHFETAELARTGGQPAFAVSCLSQAIYPAIEQLEAPEKIRQLLAAIELGLTLELRVEAKLRIYDVIEQISPMDYANLEGAAMLMTKLELVDDAVHLLTDRWFRESFTEDPQYLSEQDIRLNIIKRRFPLFAEYLGSLKP